MVRTCHRCGTKTDAWCPVCVAEITAPRTVEAMSTDERVDELASWLGPLEVPFHDVHKRIEDLMQRPVWTHELAFPDSLLSELKSR